MAISSDERKFFVTLGASIAQLSMTQQRFVTQMLDAGG